MRGGRGGATGRRPFLALLAAVAAAAAALVAASAVASRAFAALPSAQGHAAAGESRTASKPSSRRMLLQLPAAAAAAAAALGAKPARGAGEDEGKYTITYKEPIGDDLFVGGGRGATEGDMYRIRVTEIKPGGIAEKAGAKLGDFVRNLDKDRKRGPLVDEVSLRNGDADQILKSFTARRKPIVGANILLQPGNVPQPGEKPPEFRLPSCFGAKEEGPMSQSLSGVRTAWSKSTIEVTPADLVEGGKRAIIFFRPGALYFSGDFLEVKAFNRVADFLKARNINVVGISPDSATYNLRIAIPSKLKYPLLTDNDGVVAAAYGSAFLRGTSVADSTYEPRITERMSFVLGPDGKLQASLVDAGYEFNTELLIRHFRDIAKALKFSPEETETFVRMSWNNDVSFGDKLGAFLPGDGTAQGKISKQALQTYSNIGKAYMGGEGIRPDAPRDEDGNLIMKVQR